MTVCQQLARGRHLRAERPEIEPANFESHSQVERRHHYTTVPDRKESP